MPSVLSKSKMTLWIFQSLIPEPTTTDRSWIDIKTMVSSLKGVTTVQLDLLQISGYH